MFNYFLIFFLFFSLALVLLSKNNDLLVDYKLENHKRYTSKLKSHSIGGTLLLFFLYYNYIFISPDYVLLVFLTFIYLIGLLSDLKKLNSISLRFFCQLIFVVIFVHILNLEINYTRIELLDRILENNLINIFFVSFCLMVLINGGNFIDGLNGLILKYNIIIYLMIFFYFGEYFVIDEKFLINLITVLTIILILNLSGYLYMGDSGAYSLSLFTGIYLINFSENNPSISPYLIILFLWYPCFELLFSMIRRLLKKNKTYKPDTKHLHQLIYSFLKPKIKNSLTVHMFTTSVINIYSLVGFIIALNFIYYSGIIITIIIFNLLAYLSIYKFFTKKK